MAIPSDCVAPWLSWLKRLSSKQEIPSSNLGGASYDAECGAPWLAPVIEIGAFTEISLMSPGRAFRDVGSTGKRRAVTIVTCVEYNQEKIFEQSIVGRFCSRGNSKGLALIEIAPLAPTSTACWVMKRTQRRHLVHICC